MFVCRVRSGHWCVICKEGDIIISDAEQCQKKKEEEAVSARFQFAGLALPERYTKTYIIMSHC